jgi:YebC/PmpR family DNA-binding regulatory protein
MSGHSKWHNIKHKKAKTDAKKGLVFTKLSKEITVAAKNGGADPAININLRLLLAKAKECNMPKDNVERALKKGSGQLEGVVYETITYEGYTPENVAVVVQTLTDNKNRTISDLRHIFNKSGGRMVDTGSISWMFDYRGTIEFDPSGKDEEALLEDLLEADILDLKLGDEVALLICDIVNLDEIRTFLEAKGYAIKSMEPSWIAKNPVPLEEDAKNTVLDFLEKLEDMDDVKDIFVNMEE